MKILHDVSPQKISWVKSNKEAFEKTGNLINNLYYPESQDELIFLIRDLRKKDKDYTIIGYSSNTLFLPSFSVENMICTRELNSWYESEDSIICDCGVNVSVLSKAMVDKGKCGFEGLTDLPGTIASGLYGNCGCRGCTILSLVKEFKFLTETGEIVTLHPEDLRAEYRSTAIKRGELNGTILEVTLYKKSGNIETLMRKASYNHEYRKKNQPPAANNLGTTFNGGNKRTLKGVIFKLLERVMPVFALSKDVRKTYPMMLRLIGKSEFVPYVYYWNRYMFLDAKSHLLFPAYFEFLRSLYKDVRLEIEIKD